MKSQLSFDYEKATQAINYFAQRFPSGKINVMKTLKLIWIADRYHIRRYGRTITGDSYFALERGPIASTVKDLMTNRSIVAAQEKEYAASYIEPLGQYQVKSVGAIDINVFSDSDIEALKFAYDNFGQLDQWDLSRLSHEYPEWKKYKTALESGSSARENIDILDFFKNPDSLMGDKFSEPPELLEASKELYTEEILWA